MSEGYCIGACWQLIVLIGYVIEIYESANLADATSAGRATTTCSYIHVHVASTEWNVATRKIFPLSRVIPVRQRVRC